MKFDRVKKGTQVKIKESISLYSENYPFFSKVSGKNAVIIKKGHKLFEERVYISLDMNSNQSIEEILSNENVFFIEARFLKEL